MKPNQNKTSGLAIEAPRLVMWEPASTAPRDGTYFLSYDTRLDEICCPYEVTHFYESFRTNDGDDLEFDFWMPLPSLT